MSGGTMGAGGEYAPLDFLRGGVIPPQKLAQPSLTTGVKFHKFSNFAPPPSLGWS